jgi:hypothetical protein
MALFNTFWVGITSPIPILEYGEFSCASAVKLHKALIINRKEYFLKLVVVLTDRIETLI